MNESPSDLFKQTLDLGEQDRATLAGLLIESLEDQPDENFEAIWRAEVRRRTEELDEGKVKAVSWDEVKGKLLQKRYG